MRIICSSLLLTAVFLAAVDYSPGQTENPEAPFTLTISVNPSNPSQEDMRDKTISIAGTGVTVRIRKTNITDHAIPKPGPDNGPFGCVLDVRDRNGNPAPPHKRTGGSIVTGGPEPIAGSNEMVLQPGASRVDYAPLSEWYNLSKPGTYTIQVSQHVSNDPNSALVKSNKITVKVTP
jgi:hypothetical protein